MKHIAYQLLPVLAILILLPFTSCNESDAAPELITETGILDFSAKDTYTAFPELSASSANKEMVNWETQVLFKNRIINIQGYSRAYQLPVMPGIDVLITFSPVCAENTEATFTTPDGIKHTLTSDDPTLTWRVPDSFVSGDCIIGEASYKTSTTNYQLSGSISLVDLRQFMNKTDLAAISDLEPAQTIDGISYNFLMGYIFSDDLLEFVIPTITLEFDGENPQVLSLSDGNISPTSSILEFTPFHVKIVPTWANLWYQAYRFSAKKSGKLSVSYRKKENVDYSNFDINRLNIISELRVNYVRYTPDGSYPSTGAYIFDDYFLTDLEDYIDKLVSKPTTVTFNSPE